MSVMGASVATSKHQLIGNPDYKVQCNCTSCTASCHARTVARQYILVTMTLPSASAVHT